MCQRAPAKQVDWRCFFTLRAMHAIENDLSIRGTNILFILHTTRSCYYIYLLNRRRHNQALPTFGTVAIADTASPAGAVVVAQAGVQRVPGIAFEAGGRQVAEVVGRQQCCVVALRAGQSLAYHMLTVFSGSGAVVLARTG